MANPIRVLIAEDNEDDAQLPLRALRGGGYEPITLRVRGRGAVGPSHAPLDAAPCRVLPRR